jgi:hypothetical protein
MLSFFIATMLSALGLISHAYSADLAGCQPQLEKSLCYTQAIQHWALDSQNLTRSLKNYQERNCLPLPSKIKQTLISVYQQYPAEIQQAFCEIKKVFIVTGDVPYGALADYYFDASSVKVLPGQAGPRFSGKPIGYILEISEKNRFKGESGSEYFTRVLRARFGNAGAETDHLPLAQHDNPFGTNGALATTIVHEIGHMLGRAQKVTSTYFLPLSEGAWSKLSFKLENGGYVLRYASDDYGQRMGFKLLSGQDVQSTLDLFRKTGIATLYGGTVPQEDLAEFFMLSYYGNLKWLVDGKMVFDLQKEMATNQAFKAKSDIIHKLMALPEPFSLKNRGTVSGEIGPM